MSFVIRHSPATVAGMIDVPGEALTPRAMAAPDIITGAVPESTGTGAVIEPIFFQTALWKPRRATKNTKDAPPLLRCQQHPFVPFVVFTTCSG